MSPELFAAISPLFIVIAIALALLLMRTRRFYFIRHGETLLNAAHIRQGAGGALSPKGRVQAEKVGKYLERFPITRIITSAYPRAQETASIINERLKVPIISSTLLVERRNPSELIGKHTDEPEAAHIVDLMDLSYHSDDYRFSDEENFTDMKQRAKKCLNLLARQGARQTVVVTHHHFLKMCIAYLLYRSRLHAEDFAKLSFFNYSDNAGITVCDYHPWRFWNATRGWEVVSFNEQPTGA